MKFRLYPPVYLESKADVVLPDVHSADDTTRCFVTGDDAIVVNALHSYICSNIDLSRTVTNDDFNEALDAALSTPEHRVKKCNLAVAMFNRGGCFVAQMGKSRVLQYRPGTREFVYDSMKQVLDIYSSKAKVDQLSDFEPGDYVILTTADRFEPRDIKKILSDESADDATKAKCVAEVMKALKTEAGNTPATVISHVESCSGGRGVALHVRPKHVLTVLVACAVIALVAWIVTANPFADLIKPAPNTVNPDSLVTTKAPHQADTTFVKPEVDSLALKAERDSIMRARALKAHVLDSLRSVNTARKAAKAKSETEAAINQTIIRDVHSVQQPPVVDPAAQEPAPEPGQ